MMIRQGRYKYIYNKLGGAEELYDLEWDPGENANLLLEYWQDPNRLTFYRLDELYYYPRWEEARSAYERLRKRWAEIWDPGRPWPSRLRRLKQSWRAGLLESTLAAIRRGPVRAGRWGSRVRQTCRR
jgi:hypothetical protein